MQHDPRRGPGATRRYFAPEIIEAIAMFEEPGNECRFGDHGYDVQGRIKLIAHESGLVSGGWFHHCHLLKIRTNIAGES